MSGSPSPGRSGSIKGLGAVAVIVLVVAGGYSGLMFKLARSGDVTPPRPFTLEVKRALVTELEAAQVERRRNGNSPAAIAHVHRALALAVGHGQTRLAVYLRLTFHAGCAAAQSLYGLVRGLEIAREAPTALAVKRRVTTRAGTT